MRAVLGLFNAGCLLRFKSGLDGAFGKDVGRWFVLLMAGQFHVLFYASRTLPNMFAFGLSELRVIRRESEMLRRSSYAGFR